MYDGESEMHISKNYGPHNYFEEQTALISLLMEGTNDPQNQKSLCLALECNIFIANLLL